MEKKVRFNPEVKEDWAPDYDRKVISWLYSNQKVLEEIANNKEESEIVETQTRAQQKITVTKTAELPSIHSILKKGINLYVDPDLKFSKLCEEAQDILENITDPNNNSVKKSRKKSKYKILFSGEQDTKKWRNSMTKLGISLADSVESCSLLLSNNIKTSRKFICALALGKPILNLNWLEDSIKAAKCLDNFDDYILKDEEIEYKYKFSLKESMERAKKKHLLEGYTVLLTPNIEKFLLDDLIEMIKASRGRPFVGIPTNLIWPEGVFIVSTNNDIETARNYAARASKRECYKIMVKSKSFIVSSILKQELDFTVHNLKLN